MAYENLNDFVKYIRVIQEKDDNNVTIGVTGVLGSGKSTFAIQVARRYIEKYLGEPSFNIKKYVAYNNDEVMEKIYNLPKYSPLIGDEAVRFAWSRDWNRAENRELARLSAQIRTKKLIFFMNIPRLSWIDSAYRESMLDVWIWVHSCFNEEGEKECYALMFEPDQNQSQKDSWHLDYLKKFAKKKERIGRFTDIDRLYKIVRNSPCFNDMFKFPKLPQEIYNRYLVIRDKRAFEKQNQFVNQKDTSKILIYNLKKYWPEFLEAVNNGRQKKPSFKMISEILLKHPQTSNILANQNTLITWYKGIEENLIQ